MGQLLQPAKRGLAMFISVVLALAASWVVASVSPAAAVVAPVEQRQPVGVTADGLPTVQIDGVVWDQEVVGDTVYAGGDFKNARPAGAAPGTNLSPRSNLLAYNIRTGELVTGFAPVVNGPVKSISKSPDGSRIYIGGTFTSVNGVGRYRLAAFSTATGALETKFAAGVNAGVNDVTVTESAVYVGGAFTSVGTSSRPKLAAFNPTNGALLGWAPVVDSGSVQALVVTPDKSRVVVAGNFPSLNGTSAPGMGAVDAVSGAVLPWAANQVVRNYGASAAMLSLSTDGTNIYSAGYWFGGTGNFEGVLAADPNTGAIKWLADCHGDSYDASAAGGVVYAVSHWHHCSNIGGFPDTSPRTQWYRSNAMTAEAKGTVAPNNQGGYANFAGQGAPAMINWFPTMDVGSFTGQSQAGWTTEGTDEYLVQGGEFPKVNGVPQQGLVRFAIPSLAPKKQGPRLSGDVQNPALLDLGNGSIKIKWQTNWDRDDQVLSYDIQRADSANPVHTTAATSQFWNRPFLSFTDTTTRAGTSYSYRISAYDADGNRVSSNYVSITPTTGASAYAPQVVADGASSYWRMGNSGGYPDYVGNLDLTAGAGVTPAASGAIKGDGDGSATFNGTSTGTAGATTTSAAPNTFTAEAWVKTTTTTGGKIVGFGNNQTALSSNADRHIYMDNLGRLVFGVTSSGGVKTVIQSSSSFNNGQWHHVAAQLSGAGMALYVDGVRLAVNTAVTTGQSYTGRWRVGGDNLAGWTGAPSSNFLAGSIDDVAIYPTALSPAKVLDHYTRATATSTPTNQVPTPAFTSSCQELSCTFDGSASRDADGTVSVYSWDFGDGTTGSGVTARHTYAAARDYTVKLTVTDNNGASSSTTQTVSVAQQPPANQPPVAEFTAACAGLTCSFDASKSVDPDGNVTSYSWVFGDGSTGSGATTSHAYASAGTYDVKLTVTDSAGATTSKTGVVTVATTANQSPTASFTSSVTGSAASFDAAGSSDPEGSSLSYAWTFGDGSTATGQKAAHTYSGTGVFAVTLRVTDAAGAGHAVTRTVTVGANPAVLDTFSRTATKWGVAETGGTYTYAGATHLLSGTAGQIRLASAGGSATASLAGVARRDVDVTADLSLDKVATGGGMQTSLMVRRNGSSDYRLSLQHLSTGAVRLSVVRVVAGTSTTLRSVNVSGVTYREGSVLRVRLKATGTGSTALAATVWEAGTPEPPAQVTASDAAAELQGAGSFAIYNYLSASAVNAPVTVSVDNLLVS